MCEELHRTYLNKNQVYGDSFGKTYREFGIISAVIRMNDKWNRFIELTKGTENNVKDESIYDTLMDLSNYCLMTAIELNIHEDDI